MPHPFDDILKTTAMMCEICDLTTKYESDLGAHSQLECFAQAFAKAASYYHEMGNYTRAGYFEAAEEALKKILEMPKP